MSQTILTIAFDEREQLTLVDADGQVVAARTVAAYDGRSARYEAFTAVVDDVPSLVWGWLTARRRTVLDAAADRYASDPD